MGRSVIKIAEKNKDGEKMMREKTGRQAYASDLTDKQWEEIEPLYTGMRTYKWSNVFSGFWVQMETITP